MEVLEKAIADARTRRGWTAPKPVVAEVDGDDDSLYDQDPLGLAAALASIAHATLASPNNCHSVPDECCQGDRWKGR
jgi:hypothetical protein